jgi:hypothetical protein
MTHEGSVKSLKLFLLFLIISLSYTALVFAQETGASAEKKDPVYDLLTIVISGLAFVFPIVSLMVTLIFQYLRKPLINIKVGEIAEIFKTYDNGLALTLDTIILNNGAQYGTVYQISGMISDAGSTQVGRLIWRMFVENKNLGEPGKQLRTFNEFVGMASPVVIPNRQAVSKRIQFDTAAPFELFAKKYRVEVFAYEIQKPKQFSKAAFTFTASPEDVNKFNNTKAFGPGLPTQGSVRLIITLEDV